MKKNQSEIQKNSSRTGNDKDLIFAGFGGNAPAKRGGGN